MNRLAAWLTVIRDCGWFAPSMAGGFPVPSARQGWIAFAALLAILMASIVLPRELAAILRIAAVLCYIGLSYWTLELRR